jgi:nitrogen fixation protein FixH
MTRRFTGWHMTAIMLAFFGTIIAVNVTMAVFATTTFGGKVVENSYVASQKYNEWLAAARAQQQLGWTHDVMLDGDRHVRVDLSVPDARVEAVARHPLGRQAEVTLLFSGVDGRFRSTEPLPAGRWIVHLTVTSGAEQARYIETVQ